MSILTLDFNALRLAFGAGCLMCLAACSGDADTPQATTRDGAASGEILESSISDAMIPLEEARSSAPIMEPVPASSGQAGSPAADGSPDDGAEAADVAPAVADSTAQTAPAPEGGSQQSPD